jgi:hypothetical protein
MTGFEMNSITEYNGPAKRKSGFRAVPLHKFINGMPVTTLGISGTQAVENGGFRLIQVR